MFCIVSITNQWNLHSSIRFSKTETVLSKLLQYQALFWTFYVSKIWIHQLFLKAIKKFLWSKELKTKKKKNTLVQEYTDVLLSFWTSNMLFFEVCYPLHSFIYFNNFLFLFVGLENAPFLRHGHASVQNSLH